MGSRFQCISRVRGFAAPGTKQHRRKYHSEVLSVQLLVLGERRAKHFVALEQKVRLRVYTGNDGFVQRCKLFVRNVGKQQRRDRRHKDAQPIQQALWMLLSGGIKSRLLSLKLLLY